MQVELYETQLRFLDKVVEQGRYGGNREEVMKSILVEHVNQRVAGAKGYVGGKPKEETLRTKYPKYGKPRFTKILEPVSGKAVPVYKGEVLRIEQLEGGQCVDFNAFNLHDYKEFLDCGFTRSFQSFNPRNGEFIWTNAPRGRPMFAILEIADTCELDIVGHRCNRIFQELGWGETRHVNCQDTLSEAIREYGLTPDDVHDSFNLWMSTTIDEQGRRQFKWNPAKKGDVIDLLAIFDVLAAAVTCGIGDLVGINNYTFTPVKMEIYKSSPETMRLANQVEWRWGKLKSQMSAKDFVVKRIRATRELQADPNYKPNFLPLPKRMKIGVHLSDEEKKLVKGLIETGVYGSTPAEAMRAAFMRWCNSNVTLIRKAMLRFD